MEYYRRRSNNRYYIMAIILVIAAIIIAYFLFANNKNVSYENKISETNKQNLVKQQPETNEIVATSSDVEKVTPNTEIIYQYYYELDKKQVVKKEAPPYYLINLTEEEFKEKLSDWKIIKFSSKQIILQKNINEMSPFYFMIGERDGYVAVYYKNSEEDIRLREITDTPLSKFPPEEQERIKKGITVYGEDELIKTLEDYSS